MQDIYDYILGEQGFADDLMLQYKQTSKVGKGGQGEVHIARHRKSLINYAVKIVERRRADYLFDGVQGEFLEGEIMIESTKKHLPHVLHIVQAVSDRTYYYLITKFMTGGNLCEYMRHVRLRPDHDIEAVAKRIIKQVACGLQELHRENIVHRDIKSLNILMDSTRPDAMAYIADFGISIKLESFTQKLSYMIGTNGFIAPEVL